MEKLKTRLQFSFSTKVLIPVLTIMVLLLAISVWIVNRRITRQFETAATDSLKTADRATLQSGIPASRSADLARFLFRVSGRASHGYRGRHHVHDRKAGAARH